MLSVGARADGTTRLAYLIQALQLQREHLKGVLTFLSLVHSFKGSLAQVADEEAAVTHTTVFLKQPAGSTSRKRPRVKRRTASVEWEASEFV